MEPTAAIKTKEDVFAALKEILPPAQYESMIAAGEVGARATKGKTDGEIQALITQAGDPHARAVKSLYDRDPEQGKGIDFVRFAKAIALGKIDGRPAQDVAKALKFSPEICDALSMDGQRELRRTKAFEESSFADGGSLVPDQVSSDFIQLLRARVVVMALGASSLQFKGSMTINKQTGPGTAVYVGEAANIPPSSPATGVEQLSARKLAAVYICSNDLLRNPSAGAEALLRDDMIKVLALLEDLTLLRSVGGSYAPKGLLYQTNAANQFASAGTSLANKVADLGTAIRLVEQSNIPITRGGWAFHPRTKWSLATTLDSLGHFVFLDQIMADSLFGYPFMTTTQIPINLSGANSEIYFGQWPELINGEDTALQVEAFPNGSYFDGSQVQSGVSQDSTPIRALKRHDAILRHDTSFSVITAVQYT